eukprot:scaffold106_cov109-Isochrysis_galbana.AAC.5
MSDSDPCVRGGLCAHATVLQPEHIPMYNTQHVKLTTLHTAACAARGLVPCARPDAGTGTTLTQL